MLLAFDGQLPLLAVHVNTLVPEAKAVTELTADSELVIIPAPLVTDQAPTPGLILFPANIVVGLLIQRFWLSPAFAIPGIAST